MLTDNSIDGYQPQNKTFLQTLKKGKTEYIQVLEGIVEQHGIYSYGLDYSHVENPLYRCQYLGRIDIKYSKAEIALR